MSDKLRIVQVGCGNMAQTWCKLAVADPRVEVVGLVDLNRAAAEATAQCHGLDGSVMYDTLAKAVLGASPDAVFDVTVPAAHHAVTMEALSLGCHVLGEKPMAEDIAQARAMVAKARETGSVYAVAQTRRPNAAAVAVQRALSAGVIGGVEEVHADFYIGARFGAPELASNFRNHMDHPLILDMSIHTFDQARQLAGFDPTHVYCHTWNPPHSWYAGDASAAAIFEAVDPQGRPVIFNYRGSWCAEGCNTDWNAAWRIVGEKGTLLWDGGERPDSIRAQAVNGEHLARSAEFFRPTDDVDVAVEPLDHEGHAAIIHNFVAHLLEGEPLWCPCEDNFKSFAMVCAAADSAARGERVSVG